MPNSSENLAIYSQFDRIAKRFAPGNPPFLTLHFATDPCPKSELLPEEQDYNARDVINLSRLMEGEVPFGQEIMYPLGNSTPSTPPKPPFLGVFPFKSPGETMRSSFAGTIYPTIVTDGREKLYYISNIYFFDLTGLALKAEQLTVLLPLRHQKTFEEQIRGWMSDPNLLGTLKFHPKAYETTNYTELTGGDYERMWAAIDYINSGRASLKFLSTSAE